MEPKCCNPPPTETYCFGGKLENCNLDRNGNIRGKRKRRGKARSTNECQTNPDSEECCSNSISAGVGCELVGTGASEFITKLMTTMKEASKEGKDEKEIKQMLENVYNDMRNDNYGGGIATRSASKKAQTFCPGPRAKAKCGPTNNDLTCGTKHEECMNTLMEDILDQQEEPLGPQCEQVFGNFIAQMHAAGNCCKTDAEKMFGIISGPYGKDRASGKTNQCKVRALKGCRPRSLQLISTDRCKPKPAAWKPLKDSSERTTKQATKNSTAVAKESPPARMSEPPSPKKSEPPYSKRSEPSSSKWGEPPSSKRSEPSSSKRGELPSPKRSDPPPAILPGKMEDTQERFEQIEDPTEVSSQDQKDYETNHQYNDLTEGEEELEWPTESPRGPLEKTPKKIPEPKKGHIKKPTKSSKKDKPGESCDIDMCDLPDCHPLKTPYPPQYRFDDVHMRRYMAHCHGLKDICSHPPGEQCWTPPPPPPPPKMREKKLPFPPDPCHPPLFPGTNLGMGCSYGLPSGNCYGKYESVKTAKESYFDCGGICPMSLLGDFNKPPPPKPPQKKKKKDEVYQFDYITVQRDKRPPPPDVCVEDEDEDECGNHKTENKQRPKYKDPCEFEEPPAPEQILEFLQRPDVHIVKEQMADIVKQYKKCGPPEKFVCQQEAVYRKAEDGRITSQVVGGNENNSDQRKSNGLVEDSQDFILRGGGSAPDWDKELEKFIKSCNKKACKKPGKPKPTGFIPCPLPDNTTVLCRVTDPNAMGGKALQCQAIPIPTGNVGGRRQFGTEGLCVGGGGNMNGLGLATPPIGYGGIATRQQQEQINQNLAQGLPPPPPQQGQVVYQILPTPQLPDTHKQRYLQLQTQQMQSVMNHANANASTSYPAYAANGTAKYAPSSTIKGQTAQPQSSSSLASSSNPKTKSSKIKAQDFPYTCEVRYHEPIHGSIYGRMVTRTQPCRLIDPDAKPKAGHNPNCPVIMETPFYNPACKFLHTFSIVWRLSTL